jgi:hypothetical protein
MAHRRNVAFPTPQSIQSARKNREDDVLSIFAKAWGGLMLTMVTLGIDLLAPCTHSPRSFENMLILHHVFGIMYSARLF